MTRLTIELEAAEPVLLGAAWRLARHWRGRARVRVGRGGADPRTPAVRIARGSVLRPALSITWAVPYEGVEAERAGRLALTSVAWDESDELEPWRLLAMPLPRVPRLGEPDPSRPWAVVTRAAAWSVVSRNLVDALSIPLGSGARAATRESARWGRQGESDAGRLPQLHFLGIPRSPRPQGYVVWWPSRRVAATLLGHATTLVASAGPLAFDAWRAGVEVLDPDTLQPLSQGVCDQDLAGLVSPQLARSPALWRYVAEQTRAVAEGATPVPLCTPRWLASAADPERGAVDVALQRIRQRIRKLRRSPGRFCAESRFAAVRGLGERIWG